jgi:glycosyltransferase involved in cell wall biosynthesis
MSAAEPRISLVTPTLNRAGTLGETIESVLRQDYGNLEYCVLDAGSQDDTVRILRKYESDPRFRWVSEPDGGQSDAINKGLALSTGELFNWINSDDYLEPGALKALAETYQRHPDADIISGLTAEFRGSPPEIFKDIRLAVRSRPEATITVGVFCQPSTFWRTSVLRELDGVDPDLHYMMDWHLWSRYLARYGQRHVVRIDRRLAHYRHHAEAKTYLNSGQFYEEAAAIFHELLREAHAPASFFETDGTSAPPLLTNRKFVFGPHFDRKRFLAAYAERMTRIHRDKNPALARKWLKHAFAGKPWITFWRMKTALRLSLRRDAMSGGG